MSTTYISFTLMGIGCSLHNPLLDTDDSCVSNAQGRHERVTRTASVCTVESGNTIVVRSAATVLFHEK